MEPLDRDDKQEDILQGMIRGEDVTKTFLNDSGEGDESLNRGVGSGEVEAEAYEGEGDEGEADGGEGDGSAGTLNIANSGEVYIYYLIKIQLSMYIY